MKAFQFKTLDECPNGVANLSKDGQKQWMEIANALLKAGDNKGFACERAWMAIKEAWVKNDEGEWTPSIPNIQMPMATVASYSLADATKEIKGIQVFETGTWNGGKYTDKDLEEMVKNFGVVDAPLKIGHDSKQTISGKPAVGWINKLYKQGKKLYADIQGIPKTVYDLIKKGAYKKRSAELYYNVVDSTGKALNNVFGGLALLGAELPAINTLEDVVALYGKEDDPKNKRIVIFEIQGGNVMPDEIKIKEEQVEEKKDELTEEVKVEGDKPAEEVKPDEKVNDEAKGQDGAEGGSSEDDKNTDTNATAKEIKDEEKKELVDEKKEEKAEKERIEAENLQLKADAEMARAEKDALEVKNFMKSIERKVPPVVMPMIEETLLKSDNVEKKEFTLKGKKETKIEATSREAIMKIFSDMPEMPILNTVTKNIEDEGITKQHKAVMEANKMAAKDGIGFKDALLKVYTMYPELVEQAKTVER